MDERPPHVDAALGPSHHRGDARRHLLVPLV